MSSSAQWADFETPTGAWASVASGYLHPVFEVSRRSQALFGDLVLRSVATELRYLSLWVQLDENARD